MLWHIIDIIVYTPNILIFDKTYRSDPSIRQMTTKNCVFQKKFLLELVKLDPQWGMIVMLSDTQSLSKYDTECMLWCVRKYIANTWFDFKLNFKHSSCSSSIAWCLLPLRRHGVISSRVIRGILFDVVGCNHHNWLKQVS